ncbi:septation ring formation regulator EzrA [Lacticaseibacillus paracasei]|uniref:Septation ring formation regulator EzrA n=2 Tax=Lacticaseibacillus paracasei TaxID=1597 RepID=A0A806L774_LACPA|nr:septation ring formation regulator EzrA [Lacticaseibacillus paracasei]AHJ33066.1 septation ring formation regulator EzrA [Lacticaseibacillus paracasei N1115]EPC49164.1 septation ring formation regulator EzrA [Lacticaseibacillus paracasei subsp. paracasei Lpp7]
MIWFFVIVVIIVVAAGGVWWLQHYFQTRIKNLDAQVEAIDVGALSSQIRSIEQLKLTGDSLATFSKWERAFDQLNDDDLADLQKILLDLEDQAKRFRFDHAQKIAKVLEAKIDTARQQYDLISQALQDIRHDEADNRSKMLQLRDDYQVSRKTILAKSFVFGDAQPALEQQLQQLAELFQKIDQINNDGDHQAAKSEIKQLSEEMAALRRQVKELPPLVNEQVNEFPAQINEIEHGYRQLTTAHYVFTDDIPGMVEDVNEKMADANTALKSLDVDATEAANSEIEAEIDKMYAIMEKEMQARKRVDAAAPDLRQFIDHALHQNRELQTELDHLNQSYTLNHNEIKIAKDLKTQLDSIDANYIKDTDAIEAGKAVYSDVIERFDATKDELTAIEKQQVQINQAVAGLKKGEIVANKQAENFELDMRNIKHEILRHHLPGLPQDYVSQVKHVTAEIEQLNHDLDQVKINMDAIAKFLIKIASDIDALKKATSALIDAAGLTEELMQYANRYKTTVKPVAEAVHQATESYMQFDYKQAADTLATALEQTEAGSYKKVEDAYLARKKASLY